MKQIQHKLQTQPTPGNLFTCFTILPARPIPLFSHNAAIRNFCLQINQCETKTYAYGTEKK